MTINRVMLKWLLTVAKREDFGTNTVPLFSFALVKNFGI